MWNIMKKYENFGGWNRLGNLKRFRKIWEWIFYMKIKLWVLEIIHLSKIDPQFDN